MKTKEIREKAGLSQAAFGEELGVTSQAVAKWEGGANIPESIKKLIRYAFAGHLPEEQRLIATPIDRLNHVNLDDLKKIGELQKENEFLKSRVEELEKDKVDLKRDKEMLQLHIETLTGSKGNRQQTA